MFPYFTRHTSLVYKLCSPGGLRQGCEILEDREGGPGGESVQETVWKSGSSREGGTAFLSVHFKSDEYDIMYSTILHKTSLDIQYRPVMHIVVWVPW